MRNYYGEIQDRLNKYRVVHKEHPRAAMLKLILWNIYYLFKVPKGDEDEGILYITDSALVEQHEKECIREENKREKICDNKIFRMALAEGGGLGDALLDTQLLKAISELSTMPIKIDFYCRSYKMFEKYPFIDETYAYTDVIDKSRYDLILIGHRFMIINHMCDAKVKGYSPVLFDFCCDSRRMIEQDLSNNLNDNIISQYAMLKKKNRIEQCNINDIMPMNRETEKYMSVSPDEFDVLEKYGLVGKKYIVFNREVDGKYDNNHPKLWALEKYNKVIRLIKQNHPDILVVQMGTANNFDNMSLVDVDLVGKTNLEQCKVVLKYSMLLVASEGGLVHVKNFLYGKSVVIFGPTIPEIFGYEENINIRSSACPNTCEWVTNSWAEKCVLGYQEPICTKSIQVDEVYDAIEKEINKVVDYKYTIQNYIKKANIDSIKKWLKPDIKLGAVGCISEDIFQAVLSINGTIDCFIDERKKRERCNNIRQIYGNRYNIPAKDNTYDMMLWEDSGKEVIDRYSLMEMLRTIQEEGILLLLIKKRSVSLLIDALQENKIDVDISQLHLGSDCVIAIKKERIK